MRVLFSVPRGVLGELTELDNPGPGEAAQVKQGLIDQAIEESQTMGGKATYKAVKRVAVPGLTVEVGTTVELNEAQAKLVESLRPGRLKRQKGKASEMPADDDDAEAEKGNDDPPGAPPVPGAKDRALKKKAGKKRRRR